MGLEETDRQMCIEAVMRRYDRYIVEDFEYQGYCSFTLLVTRGQNTNGDGAESKTCVPTNGMARQVIVQVRPAQFALNLDMAREVSRIYPSVAPNILALDICIPGSLCAYQMDRLPGTPLSRLQLHEVSPGVQLQAKQETLMMSFAHNIAQSWPSFAGRDRRDSVLQPVSPFNGDCSVLSSCTGKVGSRIIQKLQKLTQELPDQWLQDRANTTLEKLRQILEYPVVLNHGDLILSNILVDETTWEMTGLVDWAETEHLPFGTCLYGLEHMLGFLRPSLQDARQSAFVYYDNAAQLRQLFWSTLTNMIPELEGIQDETRTMRDLGVLLWHGYAWDGGAIDRVVDEVNDSEELAKLRAFLSV